MSRYLVMALVASCSLAQEAMAWTPAQATEAGSAVAPDLYEPVKVQVAMKCDKASFTISTPRDPDTNDQTKWVPLIRLTTSLVGFHVPTGDETKFTRTDLKSNSRVGIYVYKARKMPDGKYVYGKNIKSTYYYFTNAPGIEKCTSLNLANP